MANSQAFKILPESEGFIRIWPERMRTLSRWLIVHEHDVTPSDWSIDVHICAWLLNGLA